MEMQKCVFLPVVQELKRRIQADEFRADYYGRFLQLL